VSALDTNVVSELMRQAPDPAVVAWVDRHPANDVFITAVTAAICLQHDLGLGTRNVKDFADTGVRAVNPWRDYQ